MTVLGRAEKWVMNSRVRAWVQRRWEAPVMRALGGDVARGHVLEIGCGRGVGADIASSELGAGFVDAFDLDPGMVRQGRRRVERTGLPARFWVGDASRIAAKDSTYDAAFSFGVLHHLVDWRAGLRELRRVLKPGGRFFAFEPTAKLLDTPWMRYLTDHPRHDRFHQGSFAQELSHLGFAMVGERSLGSSFFWLVARKGADGAAGAAFEAHR